jgi:hypothetical protein
MIKIKTDNHYVGRDPFKDWVVIFAAVSVISIALVFVGISSYYSVDSAVSKVPVASESGKLPFDINSLGNAIKILDDRAANQKLIINANIPLSPL